MYYGQIERIINDCGRRNLLILCNAHSKFFSQVLENLLLFPDSNFFHIMICFELNFTLFRGLCGCKQHIELKRLVCDI